MLAFALQTLSISSSQSNVLDPDVVVSTYNAYEPVSKRCERSFFSWTNDIAVLTDTWESVRMIRILVSSRATESCSRSILEISGVLLRFWDFQMMVFWARTRLYSWTRKQKCWNSCLSLCTLVHNLTYRPSSSKRRPPWQRQQKSIKCSQHYLFVGYIWGESIVAPNVYLLSHNRSEMARHSFVVLEYAVRHGFKELTNAASSYALDRSLEQAIDLLSHNTYLAWVRFLQLLHSWLMLTKEHDQCRNFALRLDILHNAHSYSPATRTTGATGRACFRACWTRCYARIMFDLRVNPNSLQNVNRILWNSEGYDCSSCLNTFNQWKQNVQQRVDTLPLFSSLLTSDRSGRSTDTSVHMPEGSQMRVSTRCKWPYDDHGLILIR